MPNMSCRNWRMSIGGRDYTPCVTGFDGADSKLPTGGGLIVFTGRATLGYPDTGWDESLDDRANPRWIKGTPVLIEFQDDSGLWKTVRGCYLFVIEALYNSQNQELELQLGDELALLNFAEPPGDKSGICLGTAVSKAGLISTLLAAAGASGLNGQIGGTINSPAPKLLQGSYIEQAGAIAASEGAFLYVDRFGLIGLRDVAIDNTPTVATINLAEDTSTHKRLYGEQPSKTVEVQGNANWVTPNGTNSSSTGFELGPAAIVGINSTNQIVSRRWVRSENFNYNTRTITEIVYEPLGKLLPEDYPGHGGTIESERYYETYYYRKLGGGSCEAQQENRLVQKVVEKWQVKAVALRSVYATYPKNQRITGGWSGVILAERSVTDYDHGQPVGPEEEGVERRAAGVRIYTATRKLAGAIVPDDFAYKAAGATRIGAENLEDAETKSERWDEIRLREWEYRLIEESPLATAYPEAADAIRTEAKKRNQPVNIRALMAPVATKNEVNSSNTGNYQPPAPETPPAPNSQQQAQVKGRAVLPADGGFNYRQKTKSISLEYLTGTSIGAVKGKANYLADKWGKVIWGRYKGTGLQTEFAQHWFDFEPFDRVDLVEAEGRSSNWGEAFSISISQAEAIVGCDFIFRGWVEPALPVTPLIPLSDTGIFDITIVGHGFTPGDEVEIL